MKMPNSTPSGSCKITVVAHMCGATFPYFLWILLSFTMLWNVGCGFSVDDRVYACSTSSDCGDGWICQCTGKPVKGGRCVPSSLTPGAVSYCAHMNVGDIQEMDSVTDISTAYDISDLADSGRPDTAESADVTPDILWRDVVIKEDVAPVDPDGSVEPDAPDTVVSPPDGMIHIPSGTFWMGCNEVLDEHCQGDEKPQHTVTLSGYFIDETEVTVSAYQACVSAKVCSPPKVEGRCNYGSEGKDNHPVNCVTWCQARDYCEWNQQKRLPTEAEWEMAARGSCDYNGVPCKGYMRTYPWGEASATCDFAVMYGGNLGCGTGGTMAVGRKLDGNSPYGTKDMSGNVWEWVEDCYSMYSGDSVVNPLDVSCASPDDSCQNGGPRVLRGGDFTYGLAEYLRASYRFWAVPLNASDRWGFRCAKSIP